MATRSRPHPERATSSSTISRQRKRKTKVLPSQPQKTPTTTLKARSPSDKDEETSEGEYEVESICAHKWSSEYQECEYLIKWKGYGEEENSWVPASHMNCWDLLQAYLRTNIFNNPTTVSLTSSVPPLNKVKNHSKTKTSRSRYRNRRLTNIPMDTTLLSTKPVSISQQALTEIIKNSSVSSPAQPRDRNNAKTTTHFSTPKHPPSSLALGGRKQMKSSHSRCKVQRLPKTKRLNGRVKGTHCPPLPSESPALPSSDDSSSLKSNGSVSVESFHLYLDSDEDSSVAGSTSLSGESPLPVDQSHVYRSPNVTVQVHSSQQKRVNGLNSSHLQQHQCSRMCTQKSPQRSSSASQCTKKKVAKRNGLVHNLPGSTALSSTKNPSDDSWSRTRLRKRAHSFSPTLLLGSTTLEHSSGSHTDLPCTSTTSTLKTISSPIITSPLPVASIPTPGQQLSQQKRPLSLEYQQELIEWQFMLNEQCQPREAFIYVENEIDEAPIPWSFKYITCNLYGEGVPDPARPDMVGRICGCTCYIMGKKCGPKSQHCCPQMALAEFPYSPAGKIKLPPGNPIYECNSHCSCPHDCANRVVQHGRKVNMCIFRTSNGRGWGVKTVEPIKPNTFVTEYVGEVVLTEEAERRGQLYDREGRTYLFDLDFNCDDNAFTIDAAQYGNISHFFNHSCNPNLRVYSVWIDTLDDRLPRLAFFSTQSISAGQELTFDYQMNQEEEGQVRCLCGEANCCGYLY